MSALWVFGYGSLMWRPGFPFEEAVTGRLKGLHRALCIYSWVHRGTEAEPGLVLGLDRGGSCIGTAFLVRDGDRKNVIEYLREREQVTGVYLETVRPVGLEDGSGRSVDAVCYRVDVGHAQYAGKLSIDRQLEIVRDAKGRSGANRDYVLSTAAHLKELGIRDIGLERLANRLHREPSKSDIDFD
ncbi:MAG: gamma-glutamylcyclotransferase [Pseudomonadota bacterium]